MKSFVSKNQIESNLRRTASEGLISLLFYNQLNELSLKYYGVYQEGELIGYECPYSGEILTDPNNVVLEHIIPVSSNGGTVLFNCVPTSSKVNGPDEKGAQHLLSWWTEKDYYSPEKLSKLLSYIFEAYDKVFQEQSIENMEYLYNSVDLNENNLLKSLDLTSTSNERVTKLKEQAEKTGLITYLSFINDCIAELKKRNFNTDLYEIKLKAYESEKIFKQVDKYTLIQETLKKIIYTKLGANNRSYLTYTLHIDIKKLSDSMENLKTLEDFEQEISRRIENIYKILNDNNIDIVSYLEDLSRLGENNILYKSIDNISMAEITQFVDSINLCIDDKFKRLIEQIEKNNGRILESQKDSELIVFLGQIKHVDSNHYFNVSLSKEQLMLLKNSKYLYLRNIYEEIYLKSLLYEINIKIEDMELNSIFSTKETILKRLDEIKKINREEIYEKMHKKAIEKETMLFNDLIVFVDEKCGILPKTNSENIDELRLAQFVKRIRTLKKKKEGYGLGIYLTNSEMLQLKNSKFENLNLIYQELYLKSKLYNIEISIVLDEELDKKYDDVKKIEDRINELRNMLWSNAFEDRRTQRLENGSSKFNDFIEYINYNNGTIPDKNSENYLQSMENFSKNIRTKRKSRRNFTIVLSYDQIMTLKNSEYQFLNLIYEEIYLKSQIYGIKLAIDIDEELNNRYQTIESIQARLDEIRELNRIKGRNKILSQKQNNGASQFSDFLQYIRDNDGVLPTKRENKYGVFLSNIRRIDKRTNNFGTLLNSEQLNILKNSEYDSLKLIYEEIYLKSRIYQIPILVENDLLIDTTYNNKEALVQRLKEIKLTNQNRKRKGKN